jgi:restriction endonuclease S subunit
VNFRLDPEYYQPNYLELEEILKAIDPIAVEDFAYVTDGIHTSPDWVDEGGILYLSAKCVKNNYFVLSDAGQISQNQNRLNPRTQARVGDVLLTTVGTIGNAAVVDANILPANMDRHLGIIRISEKSNVDPYYVATFLNSKFGYFQSLRESTGNVQLNLFIEKIKKILVPIGEHFNRIGDLTRKAYDKRREAESFYAEAEALLLHELGLDNLDLSTQKSYVANFSETVESDRFDAEYFQPKYYELMKLLEFGANNKGWKLKNLGYLSQRPKYGTSSKLEYLDKPVHKSVPFLRIADLDRLKFDPNNIKYISQETADIEKQSSVQTNDVLISRSGTLGLSIVVPKELDGAIFGSYFIRTRPNKNELNPIYLSLYLNSLAGKLQFERSNTGAIQTNLTIPVIESTRIIVPPIEIQERFAQSVLDSFNVENESKLLLEQAKHQVEQIILGG